MHATAPKTTDEPRRLTPTERLHEVTLAFANRAAAPPEHSLDLTRNAKGAVQIGLTVRGHDLGAVLDAGTVAFDELCARYPNPEASTD